MFSRCPFGRGAIDLATIEELVREHVSPGGKLSLKQRGCTLEATADSDEACEKLLEAKEELQQLFEEKGVFHHLMVARDSIMENSARTCATSDAAEMWQRTLAQLELQLTRATFANLLQDSQGMDCREGVLSVAVPNRRAKDWLEARLMHTIERTAEQTIKLGAKADHVRLVVLEEQKSMVEAPDDVKACPAPEPQSQLVERCREGSPMIPTDGRTASERR